MKTSDLDKLTSLSSININNSNLILTATRMSFDKNAYIQELWSYSNKKWKKFKGTDSKNYLNPKYSDDKKYLSFIEVEKGEKTKQKVVTKINEVEVEKEVIKEIPVEKVVYEKVEVHTPFEVTKFVGVPVPTDPKDLPSGPEVDPKKVGNLFNQGEAA